jgi:hypothetical protein
LTERRSSSAKPFTAAAVYGFAIDRFPDFAPLRSSLAVELVKAGQIEDAKRVVKIAVGLDSDLKLVVLDHPGLSAMVTAFVALLDKRRRPPA